MGVLVMHHSKCIFFHLKKISQDKHSSLLFQQINWSSYLNNAFTFAGFSIPNEERVIIIEPEYLEALVPNVIKLFTSVIREFS
jgi:hypothetical protein